MKLAELTWPVVRDLSRDTLVVIPTGSLEQHGSHLPLITDTLLVTAVTEAAVAQVPTVMMTPTLWLGASLHHLPFPGTCSAQFDTYQKALTDILESLGQHGFWRFLVVNGHGGNSAINEVTLRDWKNRSRGHLVGHVDYYALIPEEVLQANVKGPEVNIHHACEIEASLILHVAPHLADMNLAVDDGLKTESDIHGLIWNFDEITEQGSYGFATLATAELGAKLFDAAVEALVTQLKLMSEPVALIGLEGLD